jgi:two-component system OmpR family response regulator
MKILLIEDNKNVANLITKGLSEEGFLVDVAFDGREGYSLALDEFYAMIILDLMLPYVDGLEILKGLRKNGFEKPVLILTAKDKSEDCIQGLNEGADDYMIKPFVFAELIARIRALLRRTCPQSTKKILECADLRIQMSTQEVTRAGKLIPLSAKEFHLLTFFFNHMDQVVTRTMIAENVWDLHYDGFSNVIDVYIHYLRKKIDEGFDLPLIQTKRGIGYIFSAKLYEI